MTDFERQVRDALLGATDPLTDWHPFDISLRRHIEKLAPSVAAAIDQASRNTESVETARTAALAALVGKR